MDHVTRWTLNGEPALLLAQPYDIDNDGLVELGNLAAPDDLEVNVDGGGWYGAGTVSVEVWRADVYREWLTW